MDGFLEKQKLFFVQNASRLIGTENERNDFYVYIYFDSNKTGKNIYGRYRFNYEPFYIGKGCKYRAFQLKRKGKYKKKT